jgi:hypothetical protein
LLTSGAGVGFGILTIAAWWLLGAEPLALIEAEDTFACYQVEGNAGSTIAGLYLLPVAGILFLWFNVALRGSIRGTQQRRNMLISDLQLMAGITFTAVYLVAAGATATSVIVAGAGTDAIGVHSLLAISAFGDTLMVVTGIRMAAIFVIATAPLGMTTGVLPRWFNLLSYGFGGLLILTPIVEVALTVAFPIWVIALSTLLLYHVARLADDEVPSFAAGYIDASMRAAR